MTKNITKKNIIAWGLIGLATVMFADAANARYAELTVLEEMNRIRAQAGLHPLQLTSIEGTRASAQRQRELNRLGHFLSVPSGVGEICAQVGEPVRAVAAWLRSPPHRAVMLCRNRTHVDIAVEGQFVVARIGRGVIRTVTREWEQLPSGAVIQTRTVERTVEAGYRTPALMQGQTHQVTTSQRQVIFPRVRAAMQRR